MSSWSKGTSKQYSPHICRWVKYCEDLDTFNSDVSPGVATTVEYSVLNTAYRENNPNQTSLRYFNL